MNWKLLGITPCQASLAGLNDIHYSPNGQEILVCGAEGLKVINPAPGADPLIIDPQFPDLETTPLTCALDHSGRSIVVGLQDEVVLMDYATRTQKAVLHRSVLPIRHVVFNQLGTRVAIACEDSKIRLIDTDLNNLVILDGHDGAVRSLAWDPQGEYIVSTGDDRTLRVWQFTSDSTKQTHCMQLPLSDNPLASEEFFQSRIRFQPPQGNLLAVPCRKSIQLLERETWKVRKELKSSESDYNGVAWSRNGGYLASYEYRHNILIWDIQTGETIHRLPTDVPITSVEWSPVNSSQLAFIDSKGLLGVWTNILPETAAKEADALAEANKAGVPVTIDQLIPADDSEEEKQVKQRKLRVRSMFDDEASVSDDDSEGEELSEEEGEDRDYDEHVHDSDLRPVRPSKVQSSSSFSKSSSTSKPSSSSSSSSSTTTSSHHRLRTKLQTRQAPFHPGEVPRNEGLAHRRYMCRNSVGAVICTADRGTWSLEAKYADSGAHSTQRWIERAEPVLAAMSIHGAVVGYKEEKSEHGLDMRSAIQYRSFDSWGTAADWMLKFNEGENVVVAAVGGDWIAVATSQRKLRIMTSAGVQKALFALPGDAVCCAAHATAPLLNLVYHVADPDADGTQRLELMQFNVDTLKTQLKAPLSMAPGARLSWLDFSPSLAPLYGDSSETLYTLESAYSTEWIPIADLKTSASPSASSSTSAGSSSTSCQHWPIGMPSWLELICLRTARGVFPSPTPEPPIAIVPLRLPLCELEGNGPVQKEEQVVRKSIELAHLRQQPVRQRGAQFVSKETARDKLLLELVHIACKEQKPVRALDICQLLTLHKSFTIASQLAMRADQTLLARRIDDLTEERFSSTAASSSFIDEPASYPTARPSYQPTSISSPPPSKSVARSVPAAIAESADKPASTLSVDDPISAKSADTDSHAVEDAPPRSDFFSPKKSVRAAAPRSDEPAKRNPFIVKPKEAECKRVPSDSLFSQLGSLTKRPRT